MQPNPYSDDPINTQPTEANPVPPEPRPSSSYNPNAPNVPPYRQNEIRSDQRANSAVYGIAKTMDYLRWVLAVLEVILLLRFLLKLIGADPFNPFASFLYSLSGFFDAPFVGIVRDPSFGTSTIHVFEWTTLIAMAIYGLGFWILWLLLRTTISRPQEPIS